MLTYKDLQDELKRRSTRDQGGTQFDTAIKNLVNFSLFRLGREAPWRVLRRKSSFNTVTSYTTGSGAVNVTNASPNVTVTGATFVTDNVHIDRMVKFSGSGKFYRILQITGETTLVLNQNFDSTSSATNTYEILPQAEYNLPIQAGHRMFMWHEAYGYPFKLQYITDQDFVSHSAYLSIKYIPTHYRMWGEDMVIKQLSKPSVINVFSSSELDVSIPITIFGVVAGYPDYEIIYTNDSDGTTTTSAGKKTFQSVERIVKGLNTIGRISATANTATDLIAVMPVGDTTAGILYKKVQLYALPLTVHPIYVQYYKDPYRLVNDGDVHELGQEFDEVLILLATSKLKAEQNFEAEADRFFMLYKDEVNNLRKTNCDKIDWFPTLKRPKNTAQDMLVSSNLLFRQAGANFGPSSRF